MSVDHPTKTWSLHDVDLMLALMEVIESPGFDIATWPHREPQSLDGRFVRQMPYPDYHSVVDELTRMCYETSTFIDPYGLLPEDPRGLDPDSGATNLLSSPRDMDSASLDQIRRYLVICTRGERFCDGHIAAEFEKGCLQAAMRRLRKLRRDMG